MTAATSSTGALDRGPGATGATDAEADALLRRAIELVLELVTIRIALEDLGGDEVMQARRLIFSLLAAPRGGAS